MGPNHERTFGLPELIQLLGAGMAPHDEEHTYQIDRFGVDLIRYLIDTKGVWLTFMEDLSSRQIKGLTGYTSTEIEKQWLLKSGLRVWGLRGGKPLLPFPFTLPQLQEFNHRSGGFCTNQVIYPTEEKTQEAIVELATRSAGAAYLANALAPRLSLEIMSILRNDAAALSTLHATPPPNTAAVGGQSARSVKWRQALFELLPAIIHDTGKSDVTTVMKELKRRGGHWEISATSPPGVLRWKDDNGTPHDVIKKTVSTAISKMRAGSKGPAAAIKAPTQGERDSHMFP